MVSHISDEMLDRIGVSGTPVEVGRRLKERCSFADRVAMIVYDETGDEEALSALTAAAKAG
jgi:hypothetical protein